MPERRLNTTQDLRRYLAGLINRTEAGILPVSGHTGFLLTFFLSIFNHQKRLVTLTSDMLWIMKHG